MSPAPTPHQDGAGAKACKAGKATPLASPPSQVSAQAHALHTALLACGVVGVLLACGVEGVRV